MTHEHQCKSCRQPFQCEGEISCATHQPITPCQRKECSPCNRKRQETWLEFLNTMPETRIYDPFNSQARTYSRRS